MHSVKTEVGETCSSLASAHQLLSELHSVPTEVSETQPDLTSTAGNLAPPSPTTMLRCFMEQRQAQQGRRDRPRLLMVAEIWEPVSQALLLTTSRGTPERTFEVHLVDPGMAEGHSSPGISYSSTCAAATLHKISRRYRRCPSGHTSCT